MAQTLFLLIGMWSLASQAVSIEQIIINKPLSDNDRRYDYTKRLLDLVLTVTTASHGEFKLNEAQTTMTRNRTFVELKKGEIIHVMAEAPKPGWEEELIPVRVPIRKGIQGFRLFIIKQQNQALLANVDSLQSLQQYPTGSGSQWSTLRVMEEAGFTVVSGSHYDGLFDMLNLGRFITFGRGVNEAFREVEAFKEKFPDLTVDEHVALFIPLPTYYFVSPKKPALAERIKAGLTLLIQDGRFDTFFYQHHCEDLRKANLAKRKIFSIPNPNLSAKTPLDVAHYWHNPNTDLKGICD